MTSNKGNQIRNKMISQYPKTDREKLAGLEMFIHHYKPQFGVLLEPYIAFTKGEDGIRFISSSLSSDAVKEFNVAHPDIVLTSPRGIIIFELDGPIHDIKTEKTDKRNKRYELNNIPYIVINETNLKYKLGVKKSNKLTQDQINAEFKERFDKL